MDEEEFIEFVNEYDISYEANGLESKEAAKKIFDELNETTVLVLNGCEEISKMYFYVERNEIQQSILIEDDKRVICTYYTPQNAERFNITLENSEKSELIGNTTLNDIPVKIFRLQNNDSYFAELTVNDTVIHCRFTNIQSIDELTDYFERMEYIEMEALLSEQTH